MCKSYMLENAAWLPHGIHVCTQHYSWSEHPWRISPCSSYGNAHVHQFSSNLLVLEFAFQTTAGWCTILYFIISLENNQISLSVLSLALFCLTLMKSFKQFKRIVSTHRCSLIFARFADRSTRQIRRLTCQSVHQGVQWVHYAVETWLVP